jgi:hypothetical protein
MMLNLGYFHPLSPDLDLHVLSTPEDQGAILIVAYEITRLVHSAAVSCRPEAFQPAWGLDKSSIGHFPVIQVAAGNKGSF